MTPLFTPRDALFAAYLHREHGAAHVLIGMDTRESGPHIASLLAAGLARAGATVAFAGVITTPGVACLVRQKRFSSRRGYLRLAQSLSRQRREVVFARRDEIP